MRKTRTSPRDPLRACQGDVYRDVEHIEYVQEDAGTLTISKVVFPFVVVLSQDCDLEQEYMARWRTPPKGSQDQWLISALVAPLYNVEHVFEGLHLSELQMRMEPINKKKTPGDFLKSNQRPRFHFMSFPNDVQVVDSVVDFKHYFSVSAIRLRDLWKTNLVFRLAELDREDLCQRFASYLSRIGLPDPVPWAGSDSQGGKAG